MSCNGSPLPEGSKKGAGNDFQDFSERGDLEYQQERSVDVLVVER